MPSKKKKYNARFPPARIKKIMQMDEEVGKVAATVPVIISRALELFIESLLQQATHMTQSKNAKTLSASHLKHIIESEERYHFLKELVSGISDFQAEEDMTPLTNHHSEANSSAAAGKKPRGRPKKTVDGPQIMPKRERRKKKKESSSSESENSQEETDEAEEGSDDELTVPSASGLTPEFLRPAPPRAHPLPSTSAASDLPSGGSTVPAQDHPPPPLTSEVPAQEQEQQQRLQLEQQQQQQQAVLTQQQQDASSMPIDLSQAFQQQQKQQQQQQQHQQQPLAFPTTVSLEDLSTFQGVNAVLPVSAATLPMSMYQPVVSNTAAPTHLFWPGAAATGMLGPAGGFPTLATTAFAAGLGPGAPPAFSGMIVPGLGMPAMPSTIMPLQGLPFSPGLSPMTSQAFAGVSVAGTGLTGVPTVVAAAAPGVSTVGVGGGAANGSHHTAADDDYDT